MADVVNRIIDTIKEAESDGPSSTTYIVDLDYDDKGNRWAVVLGWVDYDGDGEYKLWGKIAYLPKNSGMSDYDYDWMMPYDKETGEVWDTEISNPDAYDASWWLDQWEMIKKEYINAEDEDIESATNVNCVGHNDPGQYFDLIDYFDVWGNEEDGWEVNDQSVVEEKIWISDDTTEEELFNYLKDTVGYFNKNTKFSDVEIQWYDPDFIEIFQASDGCPVCSLRKSYTK